jgi:hypothetical protein
VVVAVALRLRRWWRQLGRRIKEWLLRLFT